MFTCPFCKADVPDLGWHYGGWKCMPCPEVLHAFGPEHLKHNGHVADPMLAEPKSERERAENRAARIRRWRASRKRRAPSHAGDRL